MVTLEMKQTPRLSLTCARVNIGAKEKGRLSPVGLRVAGRVVTLATAQWHQLCLHRWQRRCLLRNTTHTAESV